MQTIRYEEIRAINEFRIMMNIEMYRKTVLVGEHFESYFIQGYEGIMKHLYLN